MLRLDGQWRLREFTHRALDAGLVGALDRAPLLRLLNLKLLNSVSHSCRPDRINTGKLPQFLPFGRCFVS